jgi:hypothetical protein
MVYGTGIFEDGLNTWLLSHDKTKCLADGFKQYIVKPETVGQFTGVKDISLKVECDGDLVRSDGGEVWKVSMDDPRGLTYVSQKTGEVIIAWDFMRPHVIIGNIWENPELLKEGE